MEGEIQILDREQKDPVTKIKELDEDLVTLKVEKHHLTEYVRKLQHGIITKVRSRISNVERTIRENQVKTKKASSKKNQIVKRIKAINAEIKVLMGPISRTLRSVLRQLDTEMTLYEDNLSGYKFQS